MSIIIVNAHELRRRCHRNQVRAVCPGEVGSAIAPLSYRRHRFPPAIIQHAIWLYLRFTLSYSDVEDLLAERGLEVSFETVCCAGCRRQRSWPAAQLLPQQRFLLDRAGDAGRLVNRQHPRRGNDGFPAVRPPFLTAEVEAWRGRWAQLAGAIAGDLKLIAILEVYEPTVGRRLDRDRIRLYNAACAIGYLAFRSGVAPDQKSCGRTLAEDFRGVPTALAKLK